MRLYRTTEKRISKLIDMGDFVLRYGNSKPDWYLKTQQTSTEPGWKVLMYPPGFEPSHYHLFRFLPHFFTKVKLVLKQADGNHARLVFRQELN